MLVLIKGTCSAVELLATRYCGDRMIGPKTTGKFRKQKCTWACYLQRNPSPVMPTV